MKKFRDKMLLAWIVLFFGGTTLCTNVYILNKVKSGQGAPIFVQVSYYPAWSPLIPIKKTMTLGYNDEFTLTGMNRIRWIRVRNAENEVEKKMVVQPGGAAVETQRVIKSRVIGMGDAKINKACVEFRQLNPEKKISSCSSGHFKLMGGRLENQEVLIKENVRDIFLPLSFVITRAPDNVNFNVVVSSMRDAFLPGAFYYFVKGKNLDSYQ